MTTERTLEIWNSLDDIMWKDGLENLTPHVAYWKQEEMGKAANYLPNEFVGKDGGTIGGNIN